MDSYRYKIVTAKSRHNTPADYALVVMTHVPGSKNNEKRVDDLIKYNPLYTKFRASAMMVVKIISLGDYQPLDSFNHATFVDDKPRLTYTVGQIVKPDSYDPDEYIVCSSGIHYFKSIQGALSFLPRLVALSASEYPRALHNLVQVPLYNENGIHTPDHRANCRSNLDYYAKHISAIV